MSDATEHPDVSPPVGLNALLGALVAELAAAEVPDPLAQPLTLGAVWADLARLAGEAVPADVAALLAGEGV